MRIFSKRAFEFTNEITQESVIVAPLEFADVPEWVRESTMFKLALNDKGQPLEIIESTAQQKALENDPNASTGKRGKKTDSTEPPAVPPEGSATSPAGDA